MSIMKIISILCVCSHMSIQITSFSFWKRKPSVGFQLVNGTKLIHPSFHFKFFCWSELGAQSRTDSLSLSLCFRSHNEVRKKSQILYHFKNSSYYSGRVFTEVESALSQIFYECAKHNEKRLRNISIREPLWGNGAMGVSHCPQL